MTPARAVDVAAGSERPKRRDARRNQQLVIDAAREVLAEFGDEATMELIAERAGVGVGTIYRNYHNKSALFAELVHTIVDDLTTTARDALARDDGAALHTFLQDLGASFAEHRGYADKLMDHTADIDNNELLRLIAELLAQDQRHGTINLHVTFPDVMATVAGLRGVVHNTTGQTASSTDLWRRHLTFHLKGMQPG